MVVFMVGGMTHAEMRVAHVLSAQLERDILIGSTSVDCPGERADATCWLASAPPSRLQLLGSASPAATYLEKLASLNKAETVAQALLKGLQ